VPRVGGWPIFALHHSHGGAPSLRFLQGWVAMLPTATFVRSTLPIAGLLALLLGPRLRRHKTCEAVVHNELAVVFTAVFDEAVGMSSTRAFWSGK